MNDQELTIYICQLSMEKFNKKFLHRAKWNSRLRTTGGRFFPKDKHLDFNPKFENHPDFDKIILHELCHYHLYLEAKGYQHKDLDFKHLLSKVGGLRYSPILTEQRFNYCYHCCKCGQIYQRQRKINMKKYRCGRCRGKLIKLA
ncbi:MAG: SprT family protein [Lactovum sp.]